MNEVEFLEILRPDDSAETGIVTCKTCNDDYPLQTDWMTTHAIIMHNTSEIKLIRLETPQGESKPS